MPLECRSYFENNTKHQICSSLLSSARWFKTKQEYTVVDLAQNSVSWTLSCLQFKHSLILNEFYLFHFLLAANGINENISAEKSDNNSEDSESDESDEGKLNE